jgi:hypothetical protein
MDNSFSCLRDKTLSFGAGIEVLSYDFLRKNNPRPFQNKLQYTISLAHKATTNNYQMTSASQTKYAFQALC